MRIIAIANQKGGCGKTTTAINLAFSLVETGKKVLLIDFDPQAHATMGLNIKPADIDSSIYDVISPEDMVSVGIDDIIIPIRDHFDLAPSSAFLSAAEQELLGVEGRESMLARAIGAMGGTYDFVIIDSPPSIGHLSFNALRASREVIIPIDLSLFSLRGVSKLIEIILLLKEKMGHDTKPRALITMYDYRTRYSKHVFEKVKEEFGEKVFDTVIRYNIRLRETVDFGLPIGEYDKHAIGHKDYEELAGEVLRTQTSDDEGSYHALGSAQDLLNKTEEYMADSDRLSSI